MSWYPYETEPKVESFQRAFSPLARVVLSMELAVILLGIGLLLVYGTKTQNPPDWCFAISANLPASRPADSPLIACINASIGITDLIAKFLAASVLAGAAIRMRTPANLKIAAVCAGISAVFMYAPTRVLFGETGSIFRYGAPTRGLAAFAISMWEILILFITSGVMWCLSSVLFRLSRAP